MKEGNNKFESARGRLSMKDIAAVIISYNGGELKKVVDILLKQSGHVIVVDNGSEEKYKNQLHQFVSNTRITIIENRENKGQAEALNQGWQTAEELGYKLVLTMDQDSLPKEDCVRKLLTGIHDGYDSVGPNYENKQFAGKFKRTRFLITSGNLLRVDSLKDIGGFDKNLFIDSVDFDVSLRLRRAGYKMAMVRDAGMNHSIGEKVKDNKGREMFEHSILRHYYIARNHYYIIRKYCCFDPIFCIKKQIAYKLSMSRMKNESDYERKLEARKRGKRDAKALQGRNL